MLRKDALHTTMMEQAAADRQLFAATPTNAAGPPLRMQEYDAQRAVLSYQGTMADSENTGCSITAHHGTCPLVRVQPICQPYHSITMTSTNKSSKKGLQG